MAPKIYFIPSAGISPEVIEKDIKKYLGPSAVVQPHINQNVLALGPPCVANKLTISGPTVLHVQVSRSSFRSGMHLDRLSYASHSLEMCQDMIRKLKQASVRWEHEKSFRKPGTIISASGAVPSGEFDQTVKIWSAVLNKYVTTVAKLDSGSIGKDANLVTQGFLGSIKVPFCSCRQHDWQGLGGRLPVIGEVNLKIFPVSVARRSGKQHKGRPVVLKFGVYLGREAPFGDMLLGEEYIKDRPTFMWGHKLDPNKTPGMGFLSHEFWPNYILRQRNLVQQLQHMAECKGWTNGSARSKVVEMADLKMVRC
jgi:hypothetical protein